MGRKLPGVLLTAAMLRKAGACSGYRRMFRKKWPNGARVTPELCDKVSQMRLFQQRWGWAAEHLLTPEAHAVFTADLAPVRGLYSASKISVRVLVAARAFMFGRLFAKFENRRVL